MRHQQFLPPRETDSYALPGPSFSVKKNPYPMARPKISPQKMLPKKWSIQFKATDSMPSALDFPPPPVPRPSPGTPGKPRRRSSPRPPEPCRTRRRMGPPDPPLPGGASSEEDLSLKTCSDLGRCENGMEVIWRGRQYTPTPHHTTIPLTNFRRMVLPVRGPEADSSASMTVAGHPPQNLRLHASEKQTNGWMDECSDTG